METLKLHNEPWENTKREWGDRVRIGARVCNGFSSIMQTVADSHKKYVQQAIKEGKPVPPKVLAEYPDLNTKSVVKDYLITE